ncbi:hypothetical protein K2173_019379 [Erythroxylum novogranatense]|uniref:Uncharacterized protein n=1 Tax=Erythroxylum novogranatense TaxID=1862640 RepID=A0AAV8UFU0_9ROSI|nr:hypothetical protein K2173_019379 [Erythroxylum novogranatense]
MAYQAAMQTDNLRKGPWLEEEDERLATFVKLLGERKWDNIARASGLKRSGKSCRLRWLNYLSPNLKRGHLSAEEEQMIIQLHDQWGNKWSRIARRLPGRTDNEIKNYWRTHLRKKLQAQEEGNLLCNSSNAKNGFLNQKGDTNTRKYDIEDYRLVQDTNGTTESFLDQYVLSSFTYLDSPYETRLYDWMSDWSFDQTEKKAHRDCNGLDSCFCYSLWNSQDCENGILDCLGPLWIYE